jgi:hypothetical protein
MRTELPRARPATPYKEVRVADHKKLGAATEDMNLPLSTIALRSPNARIRVLVLPAQRRRVGVFCPLEPEGSSNRCKDVCESL